MTTSEMGGMLHSHDKLMWGDVRGLGGGMEERIVKSWGGEGRKE